MSSSNSPSEGSPSTSPTSRGLLSSSLSSSSTLLRDFEIEMLKEKIKFMQSQINEKDTQLEYYRGLAQTLQDLLCSHRTSSIPSNGSVVSNHVTSTSAGGEQEELSTKHFASLRGKKSVSFHEDVKVHYIQDSTSSSN